MFEDIKCYGKNRAGYGGISTEGKGGAGCYIE